MKRNVDGGLVVNISSLQGLVALPQRAAYSASKHAVQVSFRVTKNKLKVNTFVSSSQAFSDSLRAEGAGDKIKVTTVSPGYVNTSLSVNAITGSGGTHGVMDEGQKHGYSAEDVAVTIAEAMEMEEKEVVIATPAYRRVSKSYVLPVTPIFLFLGCSSWSGSCSPGFTSRPWSSEPAPYPKPNEFPTRKSDDGFYL